MAAMKIRHLSVDERRAKGKDARERSPLTRPQRLGTGR